MTKTQPSAKNSRWPIIRVPQQAYTEAKQLQQHLEKRNVKMDLWACIVENEKRKKKPMDDFDLFGGLR